MEELTLSNGTVQVFYDITLGDIVITTAIGLHLVFGIVKWFLESIWRGGGR